MGNIYRDTTLNNVSEQDIGKELKVAGWVENIRDHGGVSFIDLRDMYAVLQVVIRDPELLKGIKKEECISIEGVVEKRDEETYNPKIPSGTIELEAKKITMLGQVYSTIPFEVMTSKEVREDVRLKYRYLDLRRPDMQRNLLLRSKVAILTRQFLAEEGFLEIETPTLIKSSPEGARDYLVPSRVHPGSFYALPQSPQLFKQLLMCSGYDRYFIPECHWQENKARNVLKSGMQNADSVTVYIPIESAGLLPGFLKPSENLFAGQLCTPQNSAQDIIIKGESNFTFDNSNPQSVSQSLKTLKQKHRCYAVMSIDEKFYGVTDLQHIKISAR